MEVKKKAFSKFLNYGDELFENDDTSDEVIKMRGEWESFKLGLANKKKKKKDKIGALFGGAVRERFVYVRS